jgi:hypothetical protein
MVAGFAFALAAYSTTNNSGDGRVKRLGIAHSLYREMQHACRDHTRI